MESSGTYGSFVRVILPLALPKLYTYAVPEDMRGEIRPGIRVEVQLGKRKQYAGIVHSQIGEVPPELQPKPILSVIDSQPVVTETQLRLWEWMAEYYLCTLGEVMNAALPAFLKLDSETFFRRHPEWPEEEPELTDDEILVCDAFDNQEELSLEDMQMILQRKTVSRVLHSLLQKRLIVIREVLQDRYTVKTETRVSFADPYDGNNERLHEVFDKLKRSPKQEQLLLAFLDLSRGNKPVRKSDLLKRCDASAASLDALVEKGVFCYSVVAADRISLDDTEKAMHELSPAQREATGLIEARFADKQTVLLHGVTSSGKTLVYIDLIRKLAAQEKQVLFLLPEIALTSQLIARLQRWLGNIAVYHSKLGQAERVEVWNKVLDKQIRVIVGARSALFLPFRDLGLVIVDEEHDPSYKQHDPAPRYQGRDTAVYLGHLYDARVLLGSATPSVESYFLAAQGKYGLAELPGRYGDAVMPEITFVNIREAKKKKQYVSGLSFVLRDAVQEALHKKQQVILFQNRRGYAPYLECGVCAWVPMCKNCDVTLTYHKYTNDLRCHYCGYTQSLVRECKQCGSHEIEQRGLGTERIEDDLQVLFPGARIGRMDQDTVRTKRGHELLIERFEAGEFDILVGTQMVTKGLDFERVALVGVINADALLNFPDFRAYERAYQLIVQVSGRAGRRSHPGKVFVQISDLEHPVVTEILEGSYAGFYKQQLAERREYRYPPYSRMIRLTIKDKDLRVAEKASTYIARELDNAYGERVIGPNRPLVQRINTLYIREILLKFSRSEKDLPGIKRHIRSVIQALGQFSEFKQTRVIADVDPY